MKPPEMPAVRARAGAFFSHDAWKDQGQVRSRDILLADVPRQHRASFFSFLVRDI